MGESEKTNSRSLFELAVTANKPTFSPVLSGLFTVGESEKTNSRSLFELAVTANNAAVVHHDKKCLICYLTLTSATLGPPVGVVHPLPPFNAHY